MDAPKAKRIPHPHILHGDERADDYFWLRNREDPEVIQYLEEENQYYEETMRPFQGFSDYLFKEMTARIPETEAKVPVQDGDYYYYSRMEKQLQYPIYARKRAANRVHLEQAPEEIILNLNTLAQDGDYLSVTVQRMSPDHTKLAYLENRDGTDRYTIYVKDLQSHTLLADSIPNVFIDDSLEWDGTGQFLFYITVDETQRPYQLWRHQLGGAREDELLYEERDITFTLNLYKSRSGRYLFLKSENKTTSEIRYLNADEPLQAPQLLDVRRVGIDYEMEHWGNEFLILTNDQAKNFQLLRCPVTNPTEENRIPLLPYDENRYLEGVFPFEQALLLSGREGGLTQVWLVHGTTAAPLKFDEPLYSVFVADNRSYTTTEALVQFESLLTPRTTLSIDITSGDATPLQVATVPGEYVKSSYHQERLFATANDGVQVPVVLVYRKEVLEHGPAPLILYAYGSYGYSSDPHFDPMRLPLLDLGVVYAVAQIRGGSEMGYSWYEDGKLLNKRNTFTDYIAVAEDLIHRGYTTPDKLAGIGRSAGGLLMGAVANMGGRLFKVLMPGVPFVDVVTTMLDASIPLTSLEWDEWGNPEQPDYYAYMKSYSPYDNVEAKDYPHMLVTTGLNDPRVAYWEPAKWVARLRTAKTDNNVLLLKTNMGAGHFGASGRFNHLKEEAASLAFMLDKIGVTRK